MLGIDPRGWVAVTQALILMDLRGQHYAAATASKPTQAVGPLFLVVGQCLALSTLASLFLFARVDVFFFAFVNLTLSLTVLATTLLVEFSEAVVNPRDLEILGYRPLSPRTYAAARLCNLGFYVVLMFLSLHLFPLLTGAGLGDAGWGYLPAYFLASLVGTLVVAALVVGLLSVGRVSARFDAVRAVLAWTQILLILVVFYGGQLMLRDKGQELLLWGAYPPAWLEYVPTTWLARFVERSSGPAGCLWWEPLALALVGLLALGCLLGRVTWLYRHMHPETPRGEARPMPVALRGGLRGGLGGVLARSAEERVGFWLCGTLLYRDPDLLVRSTLAFALPVTLFVLGLVTGQFGNPCVNRTPEAIALPVAVTYLLALGLPGLVHNLTFCRDAPGSWVVQALGRDAAGVARGALLAAGCYLVVPLAFAFGLVAWYLWGDPLAALLHAALALGLALLAGWASQWLVARALPFSQPLQRGGATGLNPVPLLAFAGIVSLVGGLHVLFAGYWLFWLGLAAVGLAAGYWLRRKANEHLSDLARPT
jgi:hypothetical protein